MVYPALLPLMRIPQLSVINWTEAPTDLNGLVRFAKRINLVSARVPSHFKRSLPLKMAIKIACWLFSDVKKWGNLVTQRCEIKFGGFKIGKVYMKTVSQNLNHGIKYNTIYLISNVFFWLIWRWYITEIRFGSWRPQYPLKTATYFRYLDRCTVHFVK